MIQMTEKGFFEKQKMSLVNSFNSISYDNIISILCDLGIIIFWMISVSIFNQIVAHTFADMDQLLMNFINRPTFLLQSAMVLMSVGLMLLTYAVFVIIYSLLNTYTWMRLSKKKVIFRKIWDSMKQNLFLAAFSLLMIYFIRFLMEDGIWEFVVILYIFFLVNLLTIMHVRIAEKKDAGKLNNIKQSLRILKGNLGSIIFMSFVSLVVVTIVSSLSLIFMNLSSGLESFSVIILTLIAISWVRLYYIEFMRCIKQ